MSNISADQGLYSQNVSPDNGPNCKLSQLPNVSTFKCLNFQMSQLKNVSTTNCLHCQMSCPQISPGSSDCDRKWRIIPANQRLIVCHTMEQNLQMLSLRMCYSVARISSYFKYNATSNTAKPCAILKQSCYNWPENNQIWSKYRLRNLDCFPP